MRSATALEFQASETNALVDRFQDAGNGKVILQLDRDLLICKSLEYGENELRV